MSTPEGFIRALRRLGASNELGKVAILRRSLAIEPGLDVRSFPMVEQHVVGKSAWNRAMYYLIAGLWASVNTATVIAGWEKVILAEEEEQQEGSAVTLVAPAAPVLTAREGFDPRSFGYAVAQFCEKRGERDKLRRGETTSTERRFITLLDADEEQLAHHLRQMVALLRAEESVCIHWAALLHDLLFWNHNERLVQTRWARAFYSTIAATTRSVSDNAVTAATTAATTEGA